MLYVRCFFSVHVTNYSESMYVLSLGNFIISFVNTIYSVIHSLTEVEGNVIRWIVAKDIFCYIHVDLQPSRRISFGKLSEG